MTIRRRLVRQPCLAPPPAVQKRLKRLQSAIEKEQILLDRWRKKLKRAFHAVERSQQRLIRWKRQLAALQSS